MKSVQFEVALITGSTHGIGKAIALKLAKKGIYTVINGATTTKLEKQYIDQLKSIYKDDFNNRYSFIQADISNSEDRKNLINLIEDKFGRIDILVNNAGVAPLDRKDILETSEQSFERVIDINLKGPFFLTQKIAKWMINLREMMGKEYNPVIINIGSISSFTVSSNRAEYCISKAGVSMMTKLYAIRLSKFNIPVFEIQPGIILTPMTESVKEKYDKLINEGIIPMNRWGFPKDVAEVVLSIVKGGIPYSTGDIIRVDGGFHLQKL